MTAPEFSRLLDVRQTDRKRVRLVASEAERAALAHRFALVGIGRMEANLDLDRLGSNVGVTGRLVADVVQSCAVSGEDLAVAIDEPIELRFVPASEASQPEGEVELDAALCDEIEYQGSHFDLGEAMAQSLALAIDPFAVGPQAEAARRAAGLLGEGEAGPFAALAALKGKSG